MPKKPSVDSVEAFLHNEEFLDLAVDKMLRQGWPDRGFNYRSWVQEMGNLLEGVNNDVNDPSQNEWNGPFVMSVSKIKKILGAVFDAVQDRAVITRVGGIDKVISYCKNAIEKSRAQTEEWMHGNYYDWGSVPYAAKLFFEKGLPTGEWSTPPGSQGFLAGHIASCLEDFYRFPKLNNGHPYAFERAMANAFIESEEGRQYLEDLIAGDTEGLLDKRIQRLHESKKIKITESDIVKIVNEVHRRLNEGNWGFPKGPFGDPDTSGEFNFGDDDDDPDFEMTDDEKNQDIQEEAAKLRVIVKNFVQKFDMEKAAIERWMDKKGITDETQRKQIFKKLLERKHIVMPSVISAMAGEGVNWRFINPGQKSNKGLSWKTQNGSDYSPWRNNYGFKEINVADEEIWRPVVERIMQPGELEDILRQGIDNEITDKNNQTHERNASARERIAQLKEEFPELFDGSIGSMSYLELREAASKINDSFMAQHKMDWYRSHMDKYMSQLYKLVQKYGHQMEAQAEEHNFGWANGWKEGDEHNQIHEWLWKEYQAGNPKVLPGRIGAKSAESSGGHCVSYTCFVVLGDDDMPKDIYFWSADSSD